ncbi:Cell division cycle protein 73 [Rhynchospora pubera]|uniref:Cell division cycle protein 73 n=1 Tax=Rhynchospora pubera TaxID=906938 RepID=A0AAV8D7V6_9POAL|nr:Cell division cycle protein 73 [Rhynchospora pubera]KAJ4762354.1 Cell division cycle protein 73 [Rhynchospora pubera]
MDPLTALRELAMQGELDRITESGGEFHFGSSDWSFPCTAATAFRCKTGGFYTLDALVFFLRHYNLRHTDYLQSATQHQVPAVTFPDRKPLLDYLFGHTSASASIAVSLAPSAPAPAPLAPSSFDEYRPEDDPAHPQTQVSLDTADYVSMIRALERPLKDRDALLEAKNRDFYAVYLASTKREDERNRAEAHQRKDGLVAKTRISGRSNDDRANDKAGLAVTTGSALGAVPKQVVRVKGVPIIMVPSASQTLITIYNVRDFLEDGIYVPSDVKAKAMKGSRPDCVTVQKKLSRDRAAAVGAYEVRDKPSALKADDWDRVVAVFVLGKEWQFKDWPFKDHFEIFNKVLGFFMRFEDDSVESAKVVKQWNVKIISISKNKRHQDRAAALEVWDRLEEFMRSRSH